MRCFARGLNEMVNVELDTWKDVCYLLLLLLMNILNTGKEMRYREVRKFA